QIVRTLGDTSSLTFTFSEAVDVNSILPFNIFGQTIDYTFTPTGGSNSPVVVSITGGAAPGEVPVDLNWTGVTSFTVSAPGAAAFAFDDLSVSAITPPPSIIFDFESATGGSGDDITETKDDITLTLTGSPTLGIGTGGSFGSTGQIVR
ncbi:hypothetical protein Q4Q35_09485, partial [Flavivirga aquimarina]